MKWLYLFIPFHLFSAYVGNPANPAIMNTGFFSLNYPFVKGTSGYIYDYTSNKRYTADQQNPDFDPNQTFKEFGLHSQLATFSMIFVERMEIFGSAGGTKEQAKGRTHPSFLEDFESHYQFAWSAGTKIVLIQWGKTYLSCDFTYFAIPESSKTFFKFLNHLHLPIDFSQHNLALQEWQFSGALSSRFAFLTPYAGGTYLHSRLHVSSTPETGPIDFHNERKFGWFFGLTASVTGRFHLNVERRVRDEFGYTFSTIAVF
ncbi:MAG TPA: hypothetical protein VLE95_02650 [Chlamydiales bacterium]|nr:hypothetical protein [Chlamydiales bacterium]